MIATEASGIDMLAFNPNFTLDNEVDFVLGHNQSALDGPNEIHPAVNKWPTASEYASCLVEIRRLAGMSALLNKLVKDGTLQNVFFKGMDFFEPLIEKRLQSDHPGRDFMSLIIGEKEDRNPEDIKKQPKALIFAASDTSISSLYGFLYHILANPTKLSKRFQNVPGNHLGRN